MRESKDLTPEQIAFSGHPGECFVQACPGSGKTKTVIDRLKSKYATLPPRHGVGVLSFTNAAVDTFWEQAREAGIESVLRFPSFVGTFDSFIRHFLIMPMGIVWDGRHIRPKIVESWESIDVIVRIKGVNGAGLPLDCFDPETGRICVAIDSNKARRAGLEGKEKEYEDKAKKVRYALRKSGVLSIADARLEAKRRINELPTGPAIANCIKARFKEIIVDEAQDCNPLDIAIIEWLRSKGVQTTLLADPDQVIYEFRDVDLAQLERLRASYQPADQLLFTGNFRCSQNICNLAATLRSDVRKKPDKSHNADAKEPTHIIIYPGRRPTKSVGDLFSTILSKSNVSPADSVVLAHKWKDARCTTGALESDDDGGKSNVATFARACATYWSRGTRPRQRLKVLERVEVLLLGMCGHRKQSEPLSETIERIGVNPRDVRRHALRLVNCMPRCCEHTNQGRREWLERLWADLEMIPLPKAEGSYVRRFFSMPRKAHWSRILEMTQDVELSASSVHDVKGQQFRAVCVAMPADGSEIDKIVERWEARSDSEAKRVIYVGVTRARDILALAIPATHSERILSILDGCSVARQLHYVSQEKRTSRNPGSNDSSQMGLLFGRVASSLDQL